MAFRDGGGIVVVSSGRYLTGALLLRSNVYLKIEEDGLLLGSTSSGAYPGPWDATSGINMPVLIRSVGARNIGVYGGGIIDGQAVPGFVLSFNATSDKYVPVTWTGDAHYGCEGECRPRLLQFERSENILVHNVTLRNSPDWTSHFLSCHNVLVEGVRVWGDRAWPNNDGIDPDSCTNVTIRHCRVDTGDDAICLKSKTGHGVLRNILVQDNMVRSRSSGLKLGSATQEDMFDILVERLWVWDSNRAVGIQHRDEGDIYNVTFRDITVDGTAYQPVSWWGASEPIWVSTAYRDGEAAPIGTVSDIRFERIAARSENGILLSSRTQYPVDGVTLLDVNVTITTWRPPLPKIFPAVVNLPPEHDYRPASPPIIPSPTDGLYVENVRNLAVLSSGVTFLAPAEKWWRDCYYPSPDSPPDRVTLQDFRCVLPTT
eukprot:CAMPEP_0119156600 /NCGR_PEP_ID=MMETSP1310-20130426/52338_1 /TAXON_ID=464262 /ORGANISM="Genus nov. species nov., Strain RCC2339" /LENGTH=429 /DNA_ID=CAMNT_0007149215 /DNA_START=83 /DNA_END=1372 /DNA_ORIENTATION=+